MKPLTAAQRANLKLLESDLPRRTVEGENRQGRQGHRAHITPTMRMRAVEMRRKGISLADTAAATGLSIRTIARLTQHKIKHRGPRK